MGFRGREAVSEVIYMSKVNHMADRIRLYERVHKRLMASRHLPPDTRLRTISRIRRDFERIG